MTRQLWFEREAEAAQRLAALHMACENFDLADEALEQARRLFVCARLCGGIKAAWKGLERALRTSGAGIDRFGRALR